MLIAINLHFRLSSLRLSQAPVLCGGGRVPGVLQDIRPHLPLQREEQVGEGGECILPGSWGQQKSARRSLRVSVRP